jgi:hypothetical protein
MELLILPPVIFLSSGLYVVIVFTVKIVTLRTPASNWLMSVEFKRVSVPMN